MKLTTSFFYISCLILIVSCSKLQKVTDIVVQPTARELYQREFKNSDAIFDDWNNSLTSAKQSHLLIPIPFTLSGSFRSDKSQAVGYEIELQRGEILTVDVLQVVDSSRVFIDIFQFETDSLLAEKPIVSNEWKKSTLQFEPKTSGRYKIILQPELKAETPYNLIIHTQPTLGFPVVGKTNSAIQSFWGAPRSGGSRSHEGVDIFASRGTPVIAIGDGFVSSAGERGLGGKQVWLRSGLFGISMYYAHLDSIAVKSGVRVKVGDTLGFVGNTGNAKTTNPHLHFGIYTGRGAIDPLPFIKMSEVPSIKSEVYESVGVTKQRQNQLRSGPNVSYEKVATINSKDTLQILGKSQQWFQVKVKDTLEGFMHESLITVH
ncbi:MAG: peptidoglycan DD-metalloendopeptidase family protein [Aquaticitalea sp.]